MAVIMLVEDAADERAATVKYITDAGHTCLAAEDAEQARKLLAEGVPDIVLLDIMLPGEDGFSLARAFIGKNVPVLFLTGKTAVADRVRGLQMGAWDYILKPYEPEELIARIESVLRRARGARDTYSNGSLMVMFQARRAFRNGEEIRLTAMEFDLLSALVLHRNTAMSRDQLLGLVWGYDFAGETRTVDVHIQRLRGKIGGDEIETVYRYGYRFRDEREV